jgi:hypothetical protein
MPEWLPRVAWFLWLFFVHLLAMAGVVSILALRRAELNDNLEISRRK